MSKFVKGKPASQKSGQLPPTKEGIAHVPGKRGRKKLTEEEKAERAKQREASKGQYPTNVGNVLSGMGIKAELISKKHDNSQSVTLLEVDGKMVLVLESEDRATFFRPKFSTGRNLGSAMAALGKLGVELGDEDEVEDEE